MSGVLRTFLSITLVAAVGAASAQGLLTRGGLNRGNRATSNLSRSQGLSPAAPAGAAGEAGAAEPGGRSIEFNATPVDLVFKVYGELTGRTILKDPQVPAATITLQPRQGQELSDEDKIEAIETVLEMNGIHMEKYGEKFLRALPRKTVRQEGIPLIMDPDQELGESSRVVSLMLPFKNMAVEDAQKALEGFKSASGILLVFERTNAILITDTEANINRMREIAKAIDIASPVTEVVEYIQVKNASASEIKQVIDAIVQESQKEQEANGKKVNSAAQNQNAAQPPRTFGSTLLRRPGQQNNQPAAPVNNESMFIGVSEADRGMIRGKVVTIADERSNKILIITNASNMKFFKQVIEALDVETTPDTVVKVYRLKYAEAEDVSDMINDLIGNSVGSKDSKGSQNQNAKKGTSGSVTRSTTQPTTAAKKPANQRTGEAKAGELTKDNTTVLADKRINGLVVMTMKELVPTIEQIIESMDIKLSQVLIETCIIEVTLGDGLNTGVDWVRLGDKTAQTTTTPRLGSNGLQMYRYTDGYGNIEEHEYVGDTYKVGDTTWTKTGDGLVDTVTKFVRDGFVNSYGGTAFQSMMGGGGGSGAAVLETMFNVGTNLVLTPISNGGLNYFFTSDALNLGAVITAAKSDTRAKYIASPIVMTVDNKEATIEATESRKFYSGSTSTSGYGSSNPTVTYNYTDKDIGIKIKVTPKINPNGTVMLEVEEEYSQLGAGQDVLVSGEGGKPGRETVDTALSRKMSADVLLENTQTVVLGGLTETYTSEAETGIPILKDIPIVGKWLFGSVSQKENRKELLVFMTPYVLDDASAAQFEALRRKKALSDPRAWDDHGWSASALADPISKKEQMRRIKDEWKKQDEERKTRIEIEKEKIKRAKKLQEMSKEERDLWLKMHKEELEEEKQDELEEKMQDEKSQEELKKLAADIRAKKLQSAEKELKKAEEDTAAMNERARLDAEKKAKKEAEKASAAGAPPRQAKKASAAGAPPRQAKKASAAGVPPRQAGLIGELAAEAKPAEKTAEKK